MLSLIFTTALSTAYSQKVTFGITAGPALSGTTRENVQKQNNNNENDHSVSRKSVVSFFGGFVAAVPLSKNITFRPQLEYVEKGWKNHKDYESEPDYDERLTAHCIDLPLNFVYVVPTHSGRFFLGLGPYLSLALSGKVHNELTGSDTSLTFNSSDETGLPTNRFDIGLNVITGYEFRNGFFCTLNYAHGFRDFRVELDNATNPSNKNTLIGLGIGYMFK